MKSSVRDFVIFAFGAAVGAISTYAVVKTYFEDKADSEVESVKEAYEDRLSEMEDHKSSLDGDIEGPSEIEEDEKPRATSLVSERLNNKPPLTDYTKYFAPKEEAELSLKEVVRDAAEDAKAESEHPEDDEPYSDEEDEDQTLEYEDHKLNDAHRRALIDDKPPFIIDKSDYDLTCVNYEKATLLYYVSDEVLCEETGEEISRFDVVGDCLRESGFIDNDDDVLYVRNDKLMCDYEVTKVYTRYEN